MANGTKSDNLEKSTCEPIGLAAQRRSLIVGAFSPHVAVVCSPDVDEIARDKGWSGFLDLLRPFGDRIAGRVSVRDSQGTSSSYDDFCVRFVELPRMEAGGEIYPGSISGGDLVAIERLAENYLERDDAWELYFSKLVTALPLSSHETFSHPVCCVSFVSSRNENPMDALTVCYAQSVDSGYPGYVDRSYLRYWVLIHDEQGDDLEKSNAVFEIMQRHYKTNVYMVRICSKRATGADAGVVCVPQPEWRSAGEDLVLRGGSKKYMKQADYDSLEMFVRDMTRSNIVPFMEQHVHIWNEQLAAARLGLAGRLFTASRRYFGGSNRAASGTTYSSAAGAYPVDSDEARLRKMADYAAMLRDWRLAHSTYEFLRRDYGNDKAWKHHAGAQEMAAVSQLMVNAGRVRADAVDAMLDAASYSYLSRCSLPYYALRSVVVAAELMRAGAGAGADGAAHWTMRAAALGAAGGVGVALLSEHVAHCYVAQSRRRKRAMWLVLACSGWLERQLAAPARRCLLAAQSADGALEQWDAAAAWMRQLSLECEVN